MRNKQRGVAFGDEKLKHAFYKLKEGKFEDQQLFRFIEKSMRDLKNNSECGTKIPKKLWPRIYVQKYKITNLWKYDLPDGWRLIYMIKINEVMILNIILEWFDHKEYEKRFKY